jgi:hypothetical protein
MGNTKQEKVSFYSSDMIEIIALLEEKIESLIKRRKRVVDNEEFIKHLDSAIECKQELLKKAIKMKEEMRYLWEGDI